MKAEKTPKSCSAPRLSVAIGLALMLAASVLPLCGSAAAGAVAEARPAAAATPTAPTADPFIRFLSTALDTSLQWHTGAGAAFSAIALHQTLTALSIGASGRTKDELESVRGPATAGRPAADWGLTVLLGHPAHPSPETLDVLQRSLGLSPPRRIAAGTLLERPLAGGAPCAVVPSRADALLWLMVTACASERVSWQRPPAPKDTVTAVFHGSQRDSTVRSMLFRGSHDAATVAGCDAVKLPVNGANRSIVVVLPRAAGEAALRTCMRSLETLVGARYRGEPVDVRLPELDLHFVEDLAPVLRRAGLADVVNPAKADFTPLLGGRAVSEKLFSAATHLVLDERGVHEESSAQYVAVELRTSLSKPRTITLDRPFLLCLTAGTPSTVAFVAAVTQP